MSAPSLSPAERAYVRRRWDGYLVRVDAEGRVQVRTNRPRGDGETTPWWVFAGYIEEIHREASHEGVR
ncbi:MAG: hypothetical protein Q8N53_09880 [Longimicrobiales bacterium]|nr:hypothetical protein [Longimicrobiales bacterium]